MAVFIDIIHILLLIGAFVFTYLLVMVFYFFLRKIFSHRKIGAEVVVTLTVLLINVVFRFIFLEYNHPIDGSYPTHLVGKLFYIIYDTLGAFQFEGISAEYTSINAIFTYGLLLMSALIIISVLASSISYEIYSLVRLTIERFSPALQKNTDIYVFSNVTSESLALAKSIKQKNIAKKRKNLIVFSGPNIEPFDRREAVFIDLIQGGFLYLPIRQKERQSLFKRLGLLLNNHQLFIHSKPSSRLSFFAMAIREDDHGFVELEEENTKTVFTEVKNILLSYPHPRNLPVIDFYILTTLKIDYQSIDSRLEELSLTIFPEAVSKNETLETLKRHLQIHLINEADLTACNFSKIRTAAIQKHVAMNEPNRESLFQDIAQDDGKYQVLVLGFGEIGKRALHQLYVDTAYVTPSKEEIQFNAVVIDEKINDYIGLYRLENPLFVVETLDEGDLFSQDTPIRELFDKEKAPFTQKIKSRKEYLNNKYYHGLKGIGPKFPTIACFQENCSSTRFVNLLDKVTGSIVSPRPPFNTIIISLGSDLANVRHANTLINDIRNEFILHNTEPRQIMTIAVHVRNKDFNHFIHWTEKDKAKYPTLKVIIFGNAQAIYHINEIAFSNVEKNINYGYSCIYNFTNKNTGVVDEKQSLEASFNHFISILKKEIGEHDSFEKLNRSLMQWLKNNVGITGANYLPVREKAWCECSELNKVSNRQVLFFSETMKAIYQHPHKDLPTGLISELMYYANVEHIRWTRFFIANGYIYKASNDKNTIKYYKANKVHNCLCGLDDVDYPTNLFDIINVAFYLDSSQWIYS